MAVFSVSGKVPTVPCSGAAVSSEARWAPRGESKSLQPWPVLCSYTQAHGKEIFVLVGGVEGGGNFLKSEKCLFQIGPLFLYTIKHTIPAKENWRWEKRLPLTQKLKFSRRNISEYDFRSPESFQRLSRVLRNRTQGRYSKREEYSGN